MMRAQLAVALALGCATLLRAQATEAPPSPAAVDKVFARWNTTTTPGCAVGVAVDGKPAIEKAYGMADLEHDVPNRPDTIFEAGSVSKQFTAAAVLLLARDNKLSLDDPVRKYVPELPDYGAPLTIRHMLHHMSGLRDWGALQSIAGWPRTTRTYTHAHVLDIVSRQRSLNFPPGTQYSYSNTGYNLAAIIVSRVTGKSFAELSRERLFAPLGMTHTSWRDDFTRIVKNRAIAYADARDGTFRQEMPFENVHGNAGLLTTVGDLLRWNENVESLKVGDAAFVRQQQEPGIFNDGKAGAYAFGLVVGRYKGVREVAHSGSTAGYRAHLAWYPERRVSVAVLCNVSTGTATPYTHAVADMYLAGAIRTAPAALAAPRPRATEDYKPSAEDLEAFAGAYTSDEIETTVVLAVKGDALVLHRRPDTAIILRPTTTDKFAAGSLGTITFHRDGAGRVSELGVSIDRVFDLRFARSLRR